MPLPKTLAEAPRDDASFSGDLCRKLVAQEVVSRDVTKEVFGAALALARSRAFVVEDRFDEFVAL